MVHPDAESLRDGEDVYQWYTAEIKSIPPVTRELFEKYSGVPAGQVISHISEVVRYHQIPSLFSSIYLFDSTRRVYLGIESISFVFVFKRAMAECVYSVIVPSDLGPTPV